MFKLSISIKYFLSLFQDRIRPICLPITDPIRSQSFVDYNPFVVGWQSSDGTSKNFMRERQLTVLENAKCKELYEKQGEFVSPNQFSDAVVCAGYGYETNCQGDAGLMQPVFDQKTQSFAYYLTGTLSYGLGCIPTKIPAVYARVQHFVDWIQEKINH